MSQRSAEVLARRGLDIGQEAEVLDEEGEYSTAAFYYCSAVRVLLCALTGDATQPFWADEALHTTVRALSRDYLKRAEKLSRWARISERSEQSVRSHRKAKPPPQQPSSSPPTAVLVELPVFEPPLPPPLPPPPPAVASAAIATPSSTWSQAAIGSVVVRGITQSTTAVIRALEQGRREQYPHSTPFALTGDHGETFEFVDHAAMTFSKLRNSARLTEQLYLASFTQHGPLVQLRATGRSGSFFLGTPDGRFIVKTINDEEHTCLANITEDYFTHVTSVAASLLVRFYNHFSMRLIGAATDGASSDGPSVGTVLHLVVMENLFPADKSLIVECYDLKGSTYKRGATEKEKQRLDRVLKDLDLIRGPRHEFRFAASRRALFIDAIENDSLFLERHGIMDYSLLIGVKTKTSPGTASSSTEFLQQEQRPADEAWPSSPFRCDNGGFACYGGDPSAEAYCVGIIDILQPYNVRKRVEFTLKSVLTVGKEEISATDPQHYGQRFREFLSQVVVIDPAHVCRKASRHSAPRPSP